MSGRQTSPMWLLWTVGGNKICLEKEMWPQIGFSDVWCVPECCRNTQSTEHKLISPKVVVTAIEILPRWRGGQTSWAWGSPCRPRHTQTHTRQWDRCLPTRGPERSILQLKGGLLNQHDTPLLCCFGITMSKRADRAKLDWICSVGSEIYKLQAALSGCLTLTRDHRKNCTTLNWAWTTGFLVRIVDYSDLINLHRLTLLINVIYTPDNAFSVAATYRFWLKKGVKYIQTSLQDPQIHPDDKQDLDTNTSYDDKLNVKLHSWCLTVVCK